MERRNILRKPKKAQFIEEEQAPEPNVLDDNTFDESKQIEVEVEIESPVKARKARKTRKKKVAEDEEAESAQVVEIKPKKESDDRYAHLAKAREKSLETRRKKKEEKIRLQIQAEQLTEQLRQQKEENERLRSSRPPAPVPGPPPKPKTPPRPRSEGLVSTLPSEPLLDYDILAEKIYGKFQAVETGIRQQERHLAEQEYQSKLKSYEDEQYKKRTQPKTQLYTAQRRKPNRAFDRAASAGYW